MYELESDAESLLLELLDTPAPSGFEEPAGLVWRRYAETFADEVRHDSVGNSFAVVNPGGSPKLAFVGHVDEIGLIITKIDDKGFLRVGNIGGWDVAVLVGQRVRIISSLEGVGTVAGSIGRQAIHQMDAKERTKMPKLTGLWVDIGAESADEVREQVAVGDPIVLEATPLRVGAHRIVSRSLDDRVGSFVALEAARAAKGASAEITAIGSTREEIGAAGARAATFSTRPDAAVAIDVTFASDIPSGPPHVVELGKGPTITRGSSTSESISSELMRAARDADIPFQPRGLGRRTGTDADAIVGVGPGVPVGLISLPGRYLHTPCEQADLRDIGWAIELLSAWARSR